MEKIYLLYFKKIIKNGIPGGIIKKLILHPKDEFFRIYNRIKENIYKIWKGLYYYKMAYT